MNGEPSRSSVLCQKNIWKTCVFCGMLNKKDAMRSLSSSLQLHVFVAYLKFTGLINEKKDFSSYDDTKCYECFVCSSHVEIPTRALRNIYAFPPQRPIVDGKCNPEGLLRVLKKLMPFEYYDVTVKELAAAIPEVLETRESLKVDCSCCSLLEESRRRLETVIQSTDVMSDAVYMNFSVFEELTNIAKTLKFEKVDEETKELSSDNWNEKVRESEVFLRKFEHEERKIEEMRQRAVPARPVPNRSGILGTPVSNNPLHALIADQSVKTEIEEDSFSSILKRQHIPARESIQSFTNIDSATTSNGRKRTLPITTHPPLKKIAPAGQPSALFMSIQSNDVAKVIMDSKLVVFSPDDLRPYFPGWPLAHIDQALGQLENHRLVHKSARVFQDGRLFFLKEFRRTRLKELWKYHIIPEHYCQRIIGIGSKTSVRKQFTEYRKALVVIDQDPDVAGLVHEILMSSGNTDLAHEFQRVNNRTIEKQCKTRSPMLEKLKSEAKSPSE